MIRTTLTSRMPTLRLVGTLLTWAMLAGRPTDAQAEFRIGVWQPGGVLPADTLFTQDTVDDLDALGVDLLINTPTQVGVASGGYQDFEESIMEQWSGAEPPGSRGFVVQFAPEGHSRGYAWYLERYAGSLCDRNLHNPMTGSERMDLGETVDLLVTKWRAYDAFYGYRIGHESTPCGGIYNAATYANMVTVIDSIRAHDTTRRILAIGNTRSRAWTSAEQNAFRTHFFRPASESGPANIFMQAIYELGPHHDSETEVQTEIDQIVAGLNTIGTMVRTAIAEDRSKAEWHFIANVGDHWRTRTTPCDHPFRRVPTVAELKAQVYLALSRGATGITYYLYTSSEPTSCVDNYRYNGLVEYQDPANDNQRARRMPHWNRVKTVNDTLRTLGDTLNPLTWMAGFPAASLSASTLIDSVWASADSAAAGRLEFGQFHNAEADYLLAVNRDSLWTGGRRTLDLRFDTAQMQSDGAGEGYYFVEEIVTDALDTLVADAHSHVWVTQQTLAPGDARLYRIEPALIISGPEQVEFAENSMDTVATYGATDADGNPVAVTLEGTDAGRFTISGDTLRFHSAPNYEGPADKVGNNVYNVTVTASDGSLSASRSVAVTVTDVAEPPEPPTIEAVAPAATHGHERLDVRWTAPANAGRPALEGFRVEYCRRRCKPFESPWPGHQEVAGDSATSTTLTRLLSDRQYHVRVRAWNEEGDGAWATATGRTNDPPRCKRAMASDSDSVRVFAAQAAPNPFNLRTTIQFQVPASGAVSVTIYDLTGQVVRTVAPARDLEAGWHTLVWAGRDDAGAPVASGVYLYRLTWGEQALVRKITLLK